MRELRFLAVAAVLLALTTLVRAEGAVGLNPAEVLAARDACRQLVTGYAIHRDRRDAQAVGALFAKDATFEIFGNVLRGNDAIGGRVAANPDDPTYRHLMSTIHISIDGPGRASGVSYVSVFSSADPLPSTSRKLEAIGEYHDDFVKTADGWKIERRRFVPAFLPPPDDMN